MKHWDDGNDVFRMASIMEQHVQIQSQKFTISYDYLLVTTAVEEPMGLHVYDAVSYIEIYLVQQRVQYFMVSNYVDYRHNHNNILRRGITTRVVI